MTATASTDSESATHTAHPRHGPGTSQNLTMQATLLVGFTLAMWSGETLSPLVEDEGVKCVYKSW